MTEEPPGMRSQGRLFSPLLESAVRLAARGHYHQFRKTAEPQHRDRPETPLPDRVPYISHLMGTMCILARVGVRDEVLAAAVLHDYLEDVPDPDSCASIREEVGDEVLALVVEVTENKRRDMDQSVTWEIRKSEQVEHVASMPMDAVLIKAADVLHNLMSLLYDLDSADDPAMVWRAFNADAEHQLWYFSSIADAIALRLGDHPLTAALHDAIERLRAGPGGA